MKKSSTGKNVFQDLEITEDKLNIDTGKVHKEKKERVMIGIRVEPYIKKELKILSAQTGLTMDQICNNALKEYLKKS